MPVNRQGLFAALTPSPLTGDQFASAIDPIARGAGFTPSRWTFNSQEVLLQPQPLPATAPALGWAGWALVAGALFSVWDYSRVAAIFSDAPGSPPLEQRIARGQRSVFFAHHADYAAVTSNIPTADPARAFDRTAHYLLDTRLMTAWAQALAERGDVDAARHIAARLREFGKGEAEAFFGACPQAQAVPAEPGLPFQCEQPAKAMGWQDFLPRR